MLCSRLWPETRCTSLLVSATDDGSTDKSIKSKLDLVGAQPTRLPALSLCVDPVGWGLTVQWESERVVQTHDAWRKPAVLAYAGSVLEEDKGERGEDEGDQGDHCRCPIDAQL